MKSIINTFVLCCLFCTSLSYAAFPSCLAPQKSRHLVSAFYYEGDLTVTPQTLHRMQERLSHLNVLLYSSSTLGYHPDGNTFRLARKTRENLLAIAQFLKKHKIQTQLMLSLGYWDPQPQRQVILDTKTQHRFIQAVIATLKDPRYRLKGIDIDWENLFPATKKEVEKFPYFLQALKKSMTAAGLSQDCLSVDLPGTVEFAKRYPTISQWQKAVDWANIMGYEFYGDRLRYTELDATPGKVTLGYPGKPPHYPAGALIDTLNYYTHQGIARQKIVLALPFYGMAANVAHASKAYYYGLHQPTILHKTVTTYPYDMIYATYGIRGHLPFPGNHIYHYTFKIPAAARGMQSYWLVHDDHPITTKTPVYLFVSYPDPIAIRQITRYVASKGYLGLSAWTLNYDLPFQNPHALLRTITTALQ